MLKNNFRKKSMKFIRLSLALAGICCFSNNYAMENQETILTKRSLEIQELREKAEKILLRLDQFSLGITPEEEDLGKKLLELQGVQEQDEAKDFARRGKALAQLILENETATIEVKNSAQILINEAGAILNS